MPADLNANRAENQRFAQPSRRRLPRYRVQAPLDVTLLRSGIPDTVPGRAVNLCERGIAAVVAGEMLPGEAVSVEIKLPWNKASLQSRALVRYQDRLHCGLEFVAPSSELQLAIRQWASEAKAEIEAATRPVISSGSGVTADPANDNSAGAKPPAGKPKSVWTLGPVIAAILVAVFWWHWSQSWHELESGISVVSPASSKQPQANVPSETMEKLLVHKVEPDYPEAARASKLQGVIVLDIVVGRDGSVIEMHPQAGPDVLAAAAMNAVRWWRFEPYRINGEAVVVDTTVGVEFRP